MEWYSLLCTITISIFVLKIILNTIFGDFQIDLDFDGETDIDGSSIFSFKGVLHFLLAFSSYLTLRSHTVSVNKVNGVVHFELYDYLIAIILGIIFMVAIYYVYKFAMKCNQNPLTPNDMIHNSKGKIYLNLGDGKYSVEAYTNAGTTNVVAISKNKDLKIGEEITLIKSNNQIFIDDSETNI